MPAAVASAPASAPVAAGAGGNPFQLATNRYAEKNNQGAVASQLLSSSVQYPNGGAVNSGQYLTGVRLILATVTAGAGGALASTSDFPWNIFTAVDLVNVDGSEILFSMGGFQHYLIQKYGRPWKGDPAKYPAASASTVDSPAGMLELQPEIRWTAGVLANTDSRSQYRFDYTLDTTTNFLQGGTAYPTTTPTVSVTPYMDAWAQPDDKDLRGTPNQPTPDGLALQVKRRHQTFTLNAADNVMQSGMTGNALRLQVLVTRSGTHSLRTSTQISDPFYWQVDNRSLGKLSPELIQEWAYEFYQDFLGSAWAPETGVYLFPRYLKPGQLDGQGWLYTANNTKEIFESSASTAGTGELITDEVYPVGQVDPSLTDI